MNAPAEPAAGPGPRTHIGGIEVVTREPAIGLHPLTKEEVPFRNVERVLLVNGTVVHQCMDCDYHNETVAQVTSHRSSGHPKPRRRSRQDHRGYSDETVRMVLREIEYARREGGADFCQRVATKLNASGILTYHGREWKADNVSRLYQLHHGKVRVSLRGRRLGTKNLPKAGTPDLSLFAAVNALLVRANDLRDQLQTLVDQIEAGRWSNTTPADILDKAARWDQMQALMGR